MISVISMEIEKHGSIYFLRIHRLGQWAYTNMQLVKKLRQTSKLESSQGRANPVPEAPT